MKSARASAMWHFNSSHQVFLEDTKGGGPIAGILARCIVALLFGGIKGRF